MKENADSPARLRVWHTSLGRSVRLVTCPGRDTSPAQAGSAHTARHWLTTAGCLGKVSLQQPESNNKQQQLSVTCRGPKPRNLAVVQPQPARYRAACHIVLQLTPLKHEQEHLRRVRTAACCRGAGHARQGSPQQLFLPVC